MDWINKLKKIMVDQGVNIEELKKRIEKQGNSLSRNSIGNILNERNSPKIETLKLITNALGIEFWELFSSDKTIISDEAINGFVEMEGQIYRIKTKIDLKQLYEKIKEESENGTTFQKTKLEFKKTDQETINYYIQRKATNKNNSKFNRRIFNKFNITVCSKRELQEPNNLKRDVKIWIFKSKDEARKAQNELKRLLNFKFNT